MAPNSAAHKGFVKAVMMILGLMLYWLPATALAISYDGPKFATIDIYPGNHGTNNTSVQVEITWSDQDAIDRHSRVIQLNGSDVTSSFSWVETGRSTAKSIGTVSLQVGSNTVYAAICGGGGCAERTVIYTRRETVPPTVSISPSSGTYTYPYQSVRIDWSDNSALHADSRTITLNGASVSGSFNYSGSLTSATSNGTIILSRGTNVLSARICDLSGNCTTNNATYYYEPIPPEIEIALGARSGSRLPITVGYSDGTELNMSSIVLMLNGQNVTSSFNHWHDAPTPPTHGSYSMVTLSNGTNEFSAYICNVLGACTTKGASIVHDAVAPTVRIREPDGSATTEQFSITVEWCDDNSLGGNPEIKATDGEREWLVDASYTRSNKSGCGSYAESVATIRHRTESTRVTARICDTYGNCSSSSATYIWDATPPTATITPVDGDYKDASRQVKINWADDRALDQGSRKVVLNGTIVTSRFTYLGGGTAATDSGVVTLSAGENTLVAEICDVAGNCAFSTADYFYDNSPPTVSLNPAAKASGDPTIDVVIQWGDNRALGRMSRTFTLNGASVDTVSFDYSGSETVAQSVGRLTLQGGDNTFTARICDAVGNCKAQSANYYYDTESPRITIQPAKSSSAVATAKDSISLAVTIIWTDAGGIDRNTREITLGEDTITNLFSHSGTAKVDTSRATLRLGVGTHRLRARIRDEFGNWSAYQSAVYEVYPPLTVEDAGPVLERGLCLSIALGSMAGAECGDLRIVHPLPAIRTLGKERVPTLLYNSQHAAPNVLIAVNLAVGSTKPDSVVGNLSVAGTSLPSKTWTTTWKANERRRLVFEYSDTTKATGLYPYTIEVLRYMNGIAIGDTVRGELVIVNRKDSPFGAGWWLSGLEHLNVGSMVWVGGDGSVRKYQPAGSNIWVAPSLDRPDTLRWNGTRYIRLLPGGARVEFDAVGQHLATINRLGHATLFRWNSGRLARIVLPPDSAAIYIFGYDSNGRLTTVQSPQEDSARTVTLIYSGSTKRVTKIKGPTVDSVRFAYGATSRMTVRTDRRGVPTKFFYNASKRISKVIVDTLDLKITTTIRPVESYGIAPSAVLVNNAYTRLQGPRNVGDTTAYWLDRYGAPWKIRDGIGNVTELERRDPRFPALVTRMEGPLLEDGNRKIQVATYNARGNVKSITEVNPFGDGRNATTVYEWDPQCLDHIEKITQPEREYTKFGYDTDCNRISQQDGRGAPSKVTFHYNNSYKLLSSVILPGRSEEFRDSLLYDNLGNLRMTRTPLGFLSMYLKDSLGRDTLVVTPTDTVASRDSTQLRTNGVRQRVWYDRMDRITRDSTVGPAMNNAPEQRIIVISTYDEEGNLISLTRRSRPVTEIGDITTRWAYDRAGRMIKETAPDGVSDSTRYNPAGLPDTVFTRRKNPATGARLAITMQYDELGRLKTRVIPAVTYGERFQGIPTLREARDLPDGTHPYPLYPNSGTGYRIAEDNTSFEYDAMGRITAANNGDAQVSRTYYPGGALRTELQKIRTVDGNDFSTHEYLLEYMYDLNGRRTDLVHPAKLREGTMRDRTSYTFYDESGSLKTVTDLLGNVFTYGFDLAGQLTSLTLPGGVSESYAYDLDGRLEQHQVSNGSSSFYKWGEADLRSTTIRYDGRGKIVRAVNGMGTHDTSTATYSGLGYVISSSLQTRSLDIQGNIGKYTVSEHFTHDALANFRTSSMGTTSEIGGIIDTNLRGRTQGYVPGVGRLAYEHGSAQRDTFHYDLAGNTEFSTQVSAALGLGGRYEDRASYYAADGTLRAADYRTISGPGEGNIFYRTTFEEYRYDALGRRVLVRARNWCENDPKQLDNECRISKIKRTVWDGTQELYEIQMPGHDGSPDLEKDTAPEPLEAMTGARLKKVDPNPFFGRVAYTHGLSIDQPLSLIRMGYGDLLDINNLEREYLPRSAFAIMPLWNHRGQPDIGVFEDGGVWKCQSDDDNYLRCIYIQWPAQFHAYARHNLRRNFWHGSLIEDKSDAAGTNYRRNRHYDPATGRFTQEDPIGLAGGLNLYGYANGDPVNFSDPFGLMACDPPDDPKCRLQEMVGISGRGRPGMWAGAAANVAQPIARPIQDHAVVGFNATVLNSTISCTTGAVEGCGGSVELNSPQLGASASLGIKFRDVGESGFTGGVNVGAGRHLGITITNGVLFVNAGLGIGGAPLSASIDIRSPKQVQIPPAFVMPRDATAWPLR